MCSRYVTYCKTFEAMSQPTTCHLTDTLHSGFKLPIMDFKKYATAIQKNQTNPQI